MAQFLWAARDRNGAPCATRHDAATAEDSKAALEAAGFMELRLKTDDLTDAFRSALRPGEPRPPALSPADELQLLEEGPPASPPWRQTLRLTRNTLAILGVGGLAVGGTEQPIWLVGCALLGGVLVAWTYAAQVRLQTYTRLNAAKVWGRWREVLALVDRFERLGRVPGQATLRLEGTRTRAQALAALDKKAEALEIFARLRGTPEAPPPIFHAMRATVHDAANDTDAAIADARAACDASPDSPTLWLDLATRLLPSAPDLAEARAALTRVEGRELVDYAQPHLSFAHGLLALREDRLPDAVNALEDAERGLIPFVRMTPMMVAALLFMRAYLCMALGRAGEKQRARALLAHVEPFLNAHREVRLLADCRSAAA